jgi:hypothetical protein
MILLVDSSGSIGNMNYIRETLSYFITSLNPLDNFKIIYFDNDIH